MRPLADRTPILCDAMPDRHGVHAATLRFVGAADLTEQVKCFRDLERETGPPAYRFPRQCGWLVQPQAAPASFNLKQKETNMSEPTLYQRLGGYDAIAAVCADLLPRLQADPVLERFWLHRGEDGIKREYQFLVDFLCNAAGGPMYYTGRDMKSSHKGMRISALDWEAFMRHLHATLDKFALPAAERADVVAFIESTRDDMVEC